MSSAEQNTQRLSVAFPAYSHDPKRFKTEDRSTKTGDGIFIHTKRKSAFFLVSRRPRQHRNRDFVVAQGNIETAAMSSSPVTPTLYPIEKIRERLPATATILDSIQHGFIEYRWVGKYIAH